MITKTHESSLIKRAISKEIAKKAGLCTVASSTIEEALGFDVHGDAIAIPYILDGATIFGDDEVEYVRYRIFDDRAEDELNGAKRQRYLQRANSGNRVYVPFNLDNLHKHFLCITEGEFKALSACAAGIPCVAISGVYNWFDSVEKAKDPFSKISVDTAIDSTLKSIIANYEAVVVLADSDAISNEDVRIAMNLLKDAIVKQTGKPAVYKSIPIKKEEAKTRKLGLDDWIYENETWPQRFIADAAGEALHNHHVINCGGYVALGFDGASCVVWSNMRQNLNILTPTQITQSATLGAVCGAEWLKLTFGKINDKGTISVNYSDISMKIIDECTKADKWSEAKVFGAGVWADKDDNIIVNSKQIFRPDGKPASRVNTGAVYEAAIDIGVTYDTPEATVEEVKEVLDVLNTFIWTRKTDSYLLLGWLAQAYLCGALPWRTHANLTGPAGTGKSTVKRFIENLLGSYLLSVDGNSSEAGIRQAIGKDSRPIFIDEAEADGHKISSLLTMLRTASEGGYALRGTQDQKGSSFSIKSCGIVAGIVPPVFNAADSSRFLRLELQKQPKATAVSNLVTDIEAGRKIGMKMFARVINRYQDFKANHAAIKEAMYTMRDSARSMATIGNVLAGAYTLLNDDVLTVEKAIAFVNSIDLAEARTAQTENDSAMCLESLISRTINVAGVNKTIAEAIEEALKGSGKTSADAALRSYGMEAKFENGKPVLHMNTRAQSLGDLFKGTKWDKADLSQTLKRIDGAYKSAKTARIASVACKPLVVPVDIEVGITQETKLTAVM